MDLGFEGGFEVLQKSVNTKLNPSWCVVELNAYKVQLPRTRFRTVFANDIRPDAKVAWARYFGKRGTDARLYHVQSIVELVKLFKENGVKSFPSSVDVVTGGFPCQDFSIAGKRKGFSSTKGHHGKAAEADLPSIETRGQLYMWMREVVALTQPNVFVAENVKGLTNLADVKNVIEDDFASVSNGGYLVVPAKVLHAAHYGVPQNRERVIFYGFKKSALTPAALKELSRDVITAEYDPYPVPTHYYPKRAVGQEDALLPFVTVRDAVGYLREPVESSDLSHRKYSGAKYMGKHCQGQSEVNLDGIGPTIRAEHHGNIEYRRLSAVHGGRYADELRKGLAERRLSVRECARIQTFPDDYEFVFTGGPGQPGLSSSDAYKLIGNAVPPLLAFHIARRLEDNWSRYFGEGDSDGGIK